MNFRFENVWYLIALIAVILAIVLFLSVIRWKRKSIAIMGNTPLVKELFKNHSATRFKWKFILLAAALTLTIIAGANLQKKGSMPFINRKGLDVMIVLDVSKSMLAQDIKPSRLERAKQLVNKLMEQQLQNDRVGIVLFAGRAYMQMPLTTDHAMARMYVQNANPGMVPTQGTVIGEALKMANAAFNSKEKKYKSIILISDGEDHDPEAEKVAEALEDEGVLLNTVGVGSAEGSTIIDPETNDFKKDEQGNNVITKLNEEELIRLANTTHGSYTHLEDASEAAETIGKQLSSIQKKDLNDSAFSSYISYFQYFIIAVLILLLIELFTGERKKQRLLREV